MKSRKIMGSYAEDRVLWSEQTSPPHYVWNNPGKIIDRQGYQVVTVGEIWELHHPTSYLRLDWSKLQTAADVKDAFKTYLAHVIESQTPGSATTIFRHLKNFLSLIPDLSSLQDLTYARLESVLDQMRSSGTPWNFGFIRQWYRWCVDREIPGCEEEVAEKLSQLSAPANPQGQAVMSRDPKKGPLDDHEYWLLRQAVKEGRGRLLDRVCIMLLLELGARPVQLMMLEEQDFQMNQDSNGQSFYSLAVPRAKQRIVDGQEKKRRRISSALGRAIEQLIEENHRAYGERGPQMPLLCSNQKPKRLTEPMKDRYGLHLRSRYFLKLIRDYPRRAQLTSPRTGALLILTPLRLRYTFGTRLAEQGTPARMIAELFDHSTLSSVSVYIKSTGNFVDRLNAALGGNDHYTTMIDRFLGKLTTHTGQEDPSRIIPGLTPTRKSLGGIGVCGLDSLCSLYPPLSCYVCPKFHAWADGPHEEMLRELEAYVQQLTARSGNPSDRIPHQLQDVIASIQSLLAKLQAGRRQVREDGM
jgi:integrase